jgi:segregation and condensation protein A
MDAANQDKQIELMSESDIDSVDEPIDSRNTAKPVAIVQGEALATVPDDLYIPPEALEVFLEDFEGPLDLLLYLIKRQNLDILNIPIVKITEQYMEYVELMKHIKLDLAAEYLVMAAMLAEIKARLLLPLPETLEEEDDPRNELIRRLQEYERFKQAALDIDQLERIGRDNFTVCIETALAPVEKPLAEVQLQQLLQAFQAVLQNLDAKTSHQIKRESLSIREKMTHLLAQLQNNQFTPFYDLFIQKEGRQGVVVTFIAMLELLKSHLIDIVQAQFNAPIYLQIAIDTDVYE